MTFFFFLPSILLSGFMFPFRGMPVWAQTLGEVLPLTHFLRVVRGIMLKGNDFGLIAAASLAGRGLPARHRHARAAALPPHAGLIGLVLLCDTGAEICRRRDTPGVACGGFGLLRVNLDRGRSGHAPPSRRRRHRRRARFPCRGAGPLPPDAPLDVGADDLVLELGIGARSCPAYEGADDYLLQPWPIAQLHYLRLPVLGDFGGRPETGLFIRPFVPLRAGARRGRLFRARGPRRRERRLRARRHDRLSLRHRARLRDAAPGLRRPSRRGRRGRRRRDRRADAEAHRQPRPAARPSPPPTISTPISASTRRSRRHPGLRSSIPTAASRASGSRPRRAMRSRRLVGGRQGRLRAPRRRRGRFAHHRGRQREPVHRGHRPHLPLRARSLRVAPLGTGRSPMICRTPLSGPSKLPAKARAASPAPSRAFVNLTYRPLPLCLAA